MRTITVYFETESERKKKSRKRHVFALLAGAIVAVVAVADREPPRALVRTVVTPAPPPQIIERVVEKPVIQYTAPIGPTAPAPPSPQPPPVATNTTPRVRPQPAAPPTRPRVVEQRPPVVETPRPRPHLRLPHSARSSSTRPRSISAMTARRTSRSSIPTTAP